MANKRPWTREPPRLPWAAYAQLPMDWSWSKNSMWIAKANSYSRRLSTAARQNRQLLAMLLLQGSPPRPTPKHPLWLKIHCCLPNHRGDAINVLDLVADAVQLATLLDDRWYQLDSLTWTLKPKAPLLQVWIGQIAEKGPGRPPDRLWENHPPPQA